MYDVEPDMLLFAFAKHWMLVDSNTDLSFSVREPVSVTDADDNDAEFTTSELPLIPIEAPIVPALFFAINQYSFHCFELEYLVAVKLMLYFTLVTTAFDGRADDAVIVVVRPDVPALTPP